MTRQRGLTRSRLVAQRPVVADSLCLAAIAIISALPYLAGLGFYSDDWWILDDFASGRVDWFEIATGNAFIARPVQGFYQLGLFELFGLRPLGHHIVNTIVLALCAALFHLLLVRLGFGRALAFAAALLLILLPQLSTVRVWYAAFQIPLSLALTLTSLHCQLSFARHRGAAWLGAAIVAAVLSIGAYEIFAPMLIGFAAGLAFVELRNAPLAERKRILGSVAVLFAVVSAAVAYKLMFSGRTGDVLDASRYVAGLVQLFRVDYDWRLHSSLNIFATPNAHFWAPARGFLTGAQELLSGNAGVEASGLAIVIAGVAWWRLNSSDPPLDIAAPKRLMALGIAAFLLGNVTFLIVPAVVFTPTGMGNRVHVAAALGVAMIMVSIIAVAAALAPRPARRILFNLIIVAVSASAFVRLAAIEKYWAQAPMIQDRIVAAARHDLRHLPAHSTVILDGFCPYHGPAVIFEDGDAGSALTLAFGKPIIGNVVSRRMTYTGSGLATSHYDEPRAFPYSEHLYIYNPTSHRLHRLRDADSAARYFAGRKDLHCVEYVGRGEEI